MDELITIYDIAKAAKVSPSTVSKSLTGSEDVSAYTRMRVLKAAESLGYKQTTQPKLKKARQSYLVGVIFENQKDEDFYFNHPVFQPMLKSFKQNVENFGYEVLFLSSHSRYGSCDLITHAFYRNVDGILVIKYPISNIQELISGSRGMPIVSCDAIIQRIPSVASDNFQGAQQAISYLVALGHKKIAHICGPEDDVSTAGKERFEGYKQTLRQHGIPYDPILTAHTKNWSVEAGKIAFESLPFLHGKPQFTAVFAAADIYLAGMKEVCKQKKILIPDDLSVIGFDDSIWSKMLEPSFTTIRQNTALLGEIAAKALIDAITGKHVEPIIRIPIQLVIRNSTKKQL